MATMINAQRDRKLQRVKAAPNIVDEFKFCLSKQMKRKTSEKSSENACRPRMKEKQIAVKMILKVKFIVQTLARVCVRAELKRTEESNSEIIFQSVYYSNYDYFWSNAALHRERLCVRLSSLHSTVLFFECQCWKLVLVSHRERGCTSFSFLSQIGRCTFVKCGLAIEWFFVHEPGTDFSK